MSIASQICKRTYQADGENREWEVDFPLLSEQDLEVYVTAPDGTQTQLTSAYELHLAQHILEYPTTSSGLSALSTGYTLTLLRRTPLTQPLSFTQQGTLDAQALEQGYDKLTLNVQELAEQVTRSIKYPVSSNKTGADAQTFLDELAASQTTALSGALASVEQTKQTLQQNMQDESSTRLQADVTLQQNIQTLTGTLAQKDATLTSALSAESTARATADTSLQTNLTAEAAARSAADDALAAQISQLHFIEFVSALPASGNSKYVYAVPQEQTDLENHPIVVLYMWNAADSAWNAVGAFSTNLEPDNLLTKTEAAGTYLTQTNAQATYLPLAQKSAANGVAGLDATGKVVSSQLPYATASTVGGIKQSFDSTTHTWTIIVSQ